jgi:hypothetical protein
MVEFAERVPEPGLLWVVRCDAFLGQQIENAEFLFPEPLVGDKTARHD